MQYIFFILLILFCSVFSNAQESTLISYDLSEINNLAKNEAKNIAIFLTADWCNYCHNMEINTLTDRRITKALNQDFYFVNFDGESKQAVTYQGQEFRSKANSNSNGTHEFAEAVGSINGQVIYPTFVIFSPDNEILFQHSGFLNKEELFSVLQAVE